MLPSGPPAPLPKRRNAVLRLYDAPVHRDWLFWTTVGWGVLAAISIPTSDEPTPPSPLPVWLDTLLAIVVMIATFGLLPAWLRLLYRRWRWHRRQRPAPVSAPRPNPASTPRSASAQPHASASPRPPVPSPRRDPATPPPPAADEPRPEAPGGGRRTPTASRHDLATSSVLAHMRESLPHPVARAVRSLQRAHTDRDRYEALLGTAEILAATASVTVAALLNHERTAGSGRADQESAGERNLAALRSAYTTKGVMFGTWTNWLGGLGPLAEARPGLVPGLRDALQDVPDDPGLVGHLNALREERNRAAHGDKPQSNQEAAVRVAEHAHHLERALERARFLESFPWLLTVSCSYQPRTRTYQVAADHVVGDHPDFERRTFTLDEPVGNDMLYLQTPDGPVPLSPFASAGFCSQCRQVEICYTYKAGRQEGHATLKSFTSGHDIPAPELAEEIRALPERARDGRR